MMPGNSEILTPADESLLDFEPDNNEFDSKLYDEIVVNTKQRKKTRRKMSFLADQEAKQKNSLLLDRRNPRYSTNQSDDSSDDDRPIGRGKSCVGKRVLVDSSDDEGAHILTRSRVAKQRRKAERCHVHVLRSVGTVPTGEC